jgi:hypothetical protein
MAKAKQAVALASIATEVANAISAIRERVGR